MFVAPRLAVIKKDRHITISLELWLSVGIVTSRTVSRALMSVSGKLRAKRVVIGGNNGMSAGAFCVEYPPQFFDW